MTLDAELRDVLQRHCSALGTSFISKGSSRVLAQPSNRMLFAKTGAVDQVLGEAESLQAMYRASLAAGQQETLIPTIHAFGKTPSGSKAFLVTDYRDLSGGLSCSNQRTLGKKLAQMHQYGTSQNGMYGFDRPTHCGATEQDNTWTKAWPDFWADRRIGDLVRRSGDEELTKLETQLRVKVYPLLFNDEAMRNVRPAIIHGDLWSGNAGTDQQSGLPIIFDPSSSYSHNEAELGIMKMFGGFGSEFFEAYHEVFPKAQPYYNERQEMYEAYHHLNHYVMFGGNYRSGTVRIFKKLIAWADSVTEHDAATSGGSSDREPAAGKQSGPRGLRGGGSSSLQALPHQGCHTNSSRQPPPTGSAGHSVMGTTSMRREDEDQEREDGFIATSSAASSLPPATPSQIADYFSQMICYLWFSSGVPGHSMPTTPSRSPTGTHQPLQSSPLAPRRIAASPYIRRTLRPTHAKTASTGNLSQGPASATFSSTDLSKAINDHLFAASASSAVPSTTNQGGCSRAIGVGHDPTLQRLQPKSRFLRFSREILSTTQVSTSVITLALIYVHRLKAAHPHLKGRDGSEYRLAISSLMLANKILDDNTYLNKTWAEISGMPLAEISKMEVEFWLGLKMELHVTKQDYEKGLHDLQLLTSDRNRAVQQRDTAMKRALQQQQQQQAATSQWMHSYVNPALGIAASEATLPYPLDPRYSVPFPAHYPTRRSMSSAADASCGPSFFDAFSHSQAPTPTFDIGSTFSIFNNGQTSPYNNYRPNSFTLPPSPLSQASGGMAYAQQDSSFLRGTFPQDGSTSSPLHSTQGPPASAAGDSLWSMLQQRGATPVELQPSLSSLPPLNEDLSPTSLSVSAASDSQLSRPGLYPQNSATLSGLKRELEKTNLDADLPALETGSSSKRFAAEPILPMADDWLAQRRLGPVYKRDSQSPTEARYALRSRSRAQAHMASAAGSTATHRSMSRDAYRSSLSPGRLSNFSAQASPAPQQGGSTRLPRPMSAVDTQQPPPLHPNYHSVFQSALTPNALAAPLNQNSLPEFYHAWGGSNSNGGHEGVRKTGPLQYYSLAAGEQYGNIGTYLPPPPTSRWTPSDGRRSSLTSTRECTAKTNGSGQLHHRLPYHHVDPAMAIGHSTQAKAELSPLSMRSTTAPFSLDVHAWPLHTGPSSNFLFPYHLLSRPPVPKHPQYPPNQHSYLV